MTTFPASVILPAACLCAGLMGYAIQRGATCMVAAVDELLHEHHGTRLLAIVEAALWVLGGLLLARAAGLPVPMPAGYAAGMTTVLGAGLLGAGAALNRACVFGAIARFGNGDWAYLATPLGYWLGCRAVVLLQAMAPQALAQPAPALQAPALLTLLAGLWLGGRLLAGVLRGLRGGRAGFIRRLAAGVWAPHAATLVIGVTFLLLLALVGPWTYTDLLAELAHGPAMAAGPRLLLFAALLAGAAWGGLSAGRFRPLAPRLSALVRCTAGGALMGLGSLLIPGGNDGLLLLGMPLLWPHAWLAFAVMAVTIALWLTLAARVPLRFSRRPA